MQKIVAVANSALLAFIVAGCGQAGAPVGAASAEGQAGSHYQVTVSRPLGGTIRSVGPDGQPDGKIVCATTSPGSTCGPVEYAWNAAVSFVATPDANYKFIGWAADCSGAGPCTLETAVRGADKWVAAAFVPDAVYRDVYFLVTVARPENGTITSSDGQLDCGTAGGGKNKCGPALYSWLATATLSAKGDAGHLLSAWGGDCSGAGTCSLTTQVNGTDKAVSATFGVAYKVGVAVSGLQDVGLVASNLDGTTQPILADGSYWLGELGSGGNYSIGFAAQPPTQVCTAQPATGTVPAADVVVSATCSCKENLGNCDGSAANGCETNLSFDVDNCGACGNACTVANGTPSCSNSVCGVASCAAGYTEHDGACIPVNLTCFPANGTGQQTWNGSGYGSCVVTSCNGGFHLFNNACVTDVIACSAPNATGTRTWNGTAYGDCVNVSCKPGYSNCNGADGDGCEVVPQVDGANCGACGNVCSDGQMCSNGTCAAGTLSTATVRSCVATPATSGYVVGSNQFGMSHQAASLTGALQGFPVEGSCYLSTSSGIAADPEGAAENPFACLTDTEWDQLCNIGGVDVRIALPPGASVLSFTYRYFETDYLPFNNPFRVYLIAPGGTPALIAQSWNGGDFVNKTAYGLQFGALRSVATSVSQWAGQTVTIRFQASDQTDRMNPAGALIDNLQVQ